MPTVEEKKSLEKVVEPLASKVVVKTQPMVIYFFICLIIILLGFV